MSALTRSKKALAAVAAAWDAWPGYVEDSKETTAFTRRVTEALQENGLADEHGKLTAEGASLVKRAKSEGGVS